MATKTDKTELTPVESRADRIKRVGQNAALQPGTVMNRQAGYHYYALDTAGYDDGPLAAKRDGLFNDGYDPLPVPHPNGEYVLNVPRAELWYMTKAEYDAKVLATQVRF